MKNKFILFEILLLLNYAMPIDYYNQIQPLFDANCISCHDGDHDSGLDLTDITSQNNIIANAQKRLDRMKKGNNDIDLKEFYKDDKQTLNRIEGYEKGTIVEVGLFNWPLKIL